MTDNTVMDSEWKM